MRVRQFITGSAVILIALTIVASPIFAQSKSKVLGSVHDVGGATKLGCAGCHSPHNGSLDNGGVEATGVYLLWAQKISNVASFGTYTSPSMKLTATDIGGGLASNTDPKMYSLLCMSCHDGVTTTYITDTMKQVGAVGPTSLGLTNDHPLNLNYDPATQPSLAPVATVTANTAAGGLKFFGPSNSLQCATCHEPHDPTNDPFLRKPNTNSGLCTTCHL